jgi:large subunit ribosomal protein L33
LQALVGTIEAREGLGLAELTSSQLRLHFADFFQSAASDPPLFKFVCRRANEIEPAVLEHATMRDLIKLTCQTCKRDNYVTDKNKRTQTEKFEIKKFCRACRAHTAHKEGKISKG